MLSFWEDTLAVEEIFAQEFLTTDPRYFRKNAGIADSLGLSGIASSIKDFASNYLGEEIADRGAIGGILSLISFPVLLRINPLLGIANAVASMRGYDLASIVDRIITSLRPKLEQGTVSQEDLSQIGQEVVKGASLAVLIKEGQRYYNSRYNSSFFGNSQNGVIGRIFGNLGKEKGWQFVKALVFWTIKMALMGAGIVAGANQVGKCLGIKKDLPQHNPVNQNSNNSSTPSTSSVPAPPLPIHYQPSGNGEKYFPNDDQNIWVVPVINQSLEDTLLAWTVDVYPELEGKEDQVENSPGFQRVLHQLQTNYSASTPESLKMPTTFHTRKQTVDSFVAQLGNK